MSDIIYTNPWKLSPSEVRSMDAMIAVYCVKRAADICNISEHTLRDHTKNAAQKMKARSNIIQKYLMWDRFRQQQKREAVIAATGHN